LVIISSDHLLLTIGDNITPSNKSASHAAQINIRRRFQFSSTLKRMSTLSAATDSHGRKTIAAVKGAPETLKGMYSHIPEHYDETYKYFTRRGSRVLALGIKTMDVTSDKVSLWRAA
jgi:manganese-transporting P-type ATPase